MKSWTDSLDKTKYSPETIKKWRSDEKEAKSQFKHLMKNPHRNLPDTAPARQAWEKANPYKTKVAKKMRK